MSASDYEAARERYEQAREGLQAAEKHVSEATERLYGADIELLEAVRNLRRFESQPGVPLPQYRKAA